MNKFLLKVFSFIFLLLAGASAYAVNSEYKNTLTNVDLVKTSDSAYTVNLYTSKKYNSPVKVIKKSDLSYYILLPETKNISPSINVQSAEIRNVSATLYPYAGVDINNGYTKININTTKPINFNVTTKNASQSAINTPKTTSSAPIKEEVSKKPETKAQITEPKKTANGNESAKIAKSNAINTEKKQAEIQTVKKNNNVLNKNKKEENTVITLKKPFRKQAVQQKAEVENGLTGNTAKYPAYSYEKSSRKEDRITTRQKTNAMAAAKIEPEVQDVQESEYDLASEDTSVDSDIQDAQTIQESEKEDSGIYVSKTVSFEDISDNTKKNASNLLYKTKSTFSNIISNLVNYLQDHSVTIVAIIAGVLTFGIVLFILLVVLPKLTPKEETRSELKSRADLLKRESTLVAKHEEKVEDSSLQDDAKYFVFENNVKQTELTEPAAPEEKKNYELVSYDPDIRVTPDIKDDNNNAKEEDEDLDIIQKILKDEDLVDIPPADKVNTILQNNNTIENQQHAQEQAQKQTFRVLTAEQIEESVNTPNVTPVDTPIKQNENITQPIGQEYIQREPLNQTELNNNTEINPYEPRLIATYNISPERGFMFVSYNNNINLMGFIYEDVFVLHDYNTSELSNYNLQYRLVDKDDKASVYIVKTQNAKLLVKTTRTSMNTEIKL